MKFDAEIFLQFPTKIHMKKLNEKMRFGEPFVKRGNIEKQITNQIIMVKQ